MTTVNKSLSYIDNTLVYNNECELYLPPEVLPENSVRIGNQIWSTKNLDIDDGGDGIKKWYFDGWPAEVGYQYYYTWDAAARVVANIEGWHIPTKAEWEELIEYIGGENNAAKLKSTFGWYSNNGTDDYGFNAIPVGYWNNTYNVVNDATRIVIYRTSTYNMRYCFMTRIYNSNNISFFSQITPESAGINIQKYCVRLIKDA